MNTQTDTSPNPWDVIASGYDQFVTPSHMWLANEALMRAEVKRGMTILDVACGSGALSIPAARLGARVVATDLSPAMVDLVVERARRDGFENLEAKVMDGQALELADDSFDVVASQFGLMLFPDLPAGLDQAVRVVRPGGRVVVVAYGAPDQVEFLGFFMTAVRRVVPDFEGLPSDPPPLEFQVADPAELRGSMVRAGLSDVRIDTVTETLDFGSGTELWDWLMSSNPIASGLVSSLDTSQTERVRRELDALVGERAADDGRAVLTNPVHIAVGIK